MTTSTGNAKARACQDLLLGALHEPRALHHLLDALRPRRVTVGPVAREEPQIFPELLDAELERALPRVDDVEVSPVGQDLPRQPLEVGNVAWGHDVVRVKTIQRERQPAATGLDDGHPERREHPEDPTADEGPERGHARPRIRKAVKQEPSAVQIERARPVGWPRRPTVGE